ncbi:MAG TPA: penicillin acylase family protein [Terriglobales bacterium]|nr:penicillin acylase family protein [Terriglobales bacterium]
MATPEIAPPQTGTARRALRWLIPLAVLIVLLAAGLGGWLYYTATTALPQLDGSLQVEGLSAPVAVTRDGQGVPTIEAANLDDLFLAQGYVTAQDRLWEMDMTRRFAAGEMAEVLGREWIKHDREQRILGLEDRAQKGVNELSQRDRNYLEAYARGVNAFIAQRRDRLPLEFRILHYAPRPWTAADALVIEANMIKELNHYSARAALEHEKILAKLGPDLTSDLYPNSSWRDHPPGQDPQKMTEEPPAEGKAARGEAPLRWAAAARFEIRPELGSNDWVISGAHTASGKPLLSNDPHLGHQMPALWYEAHLKSGDFDVAGVTLPGTPTVILGHNQRIAWGFTNIGPTVEDVFIENFNASGQYQTPQGWKEPQRRREVIHVKGQPDVGFDVLSTRHGPVISELIPGEKRMLALEWTLYTPDALALPFVDVDAAQSWDEFRRAFSTWVAPGQNVVYADVDGNIGYQATGRVPIRASGDGSLPVSGADNAHEWTGYVPFEKLPSVFNPPSGILATANGRITPDKYPYSLSDEWGPPYRTERIYKVLGSNKKFSPPDMLALQTDVYSAFDRFCAERFVYALDHVTGVSPRAREARELMRKWDGRMLADSAAAAVEASAREELYRLLLEPKLGAAPAEAKDNGQLNWKTYEWFMRPVWLENVLLYQPQRWLPANFKNYNELLAAAVDAAIQRPGMLSELADLRWGELNPVEINHPIFGAVPILRRWAGPGRHPQSGDSYTVKAVGRHFGPSERTTVDLANLDDSTLNIVTGQSGNLFSPYYMDQWGAWFGGATFRLPFSSQAVAAARAHQLVLQPGK